MHFDELRNVLGSSDFALWLLQQQPETAATTKSANPLEAKLNKYLHDITTRCSEIELLLQPDDGVAKPTRAERILIYTCQRQPSINNLLRLIESCAARLRRPTVSSLPILIEHLVQFITLSEHLPESTNLHTAIRMLRAEVQHLRTVSQERTIPNQSIRAPQMTATTAHRKQLVYLRPDYQPKSVLLPLQLQAKRARVRPMVVESIGTAIPRGISSERVERFLDLCELYMCTQLQRWQMEDNQRQEQQQRNAAVQTGNVVASQMQIDDIVKELAAQLHDDCTAIATRILQPE